MKKTPLVAGMMAGLAMIVIAVSTGRADPNLGNIPAHRHYVRTGDGSMVEVGPRVCGNPQLQKAFNQFHSNVHAPTGSSIGPVAPGLHNGFGAELLAGGC
jgi:hypothetical protein